MIGVLASIGWRSSIKGVGILLAYFSLVVLIVLPYGLLSLLNHKVFGGEAWYLQLVGALAGGLLWFWIRRR